MGTQKRDRQDAAARGEPSEHDGGHAGFRSGLSAAEVALVLEAAFEGAPIGVTVSSPARGPLAINQAFAAMLGYTIDELRDQRNSRAITHRQDLARDQAAIARLTAGHTQVERWEKRYIHRDGQVVLVRVTAACVSEPGSDENLIVAHVEDITQARRAEQELERAQRIAQLGSFAIDPAFGEMVWSAEMCRIFGRDPALGAADLDALFSLIHPDDAELLRRAVGDAEKIASELDLRVRAVDGPNGSCT